jgi:hypothetical protein
VEAAQDAGPSGDEVVVTVSQQPQHRAVVVGADGRRWRWRRATIAAEGASWRSVFEPLPASRSRSLSRQCRWHIDDCFAHRDEL